MKVPDDAELLETGTTDDSSVSLGAWRGNDGTIYVAGYHFGPPGDVIFAIPPEGEAPSPPPRRLSPDELKAAQRSENKRMSNLIRRVDGSHAK